MSSSAITIGEFPINPIGYGTMGLTWKPEPNDRENAIEIIKTAVEAGANFINAGEFYGADGINIKLIRAFYEKYPQYKDTTILSVKGCMDLATHRLLNSKEEVEKSVDNVIALLKGAKKLDLFQPARISPETPLEETLEALKEMVQKGKISCIGLSEVGADTIKKAAKIAPIAAVEVEFSVASRDILDNGIAQTCKELGIPIIAYSPLSRGLLAATKPEIKEGDIRNRFPRFNKESLDKNHQIVEGLKKIANGKNLTIPQVAINYVVANGFVPIPGGASVDRVRENMKFSKLDEGEVGEINKYVEAFEVEGGRYGAGMPVNT